MVSERPREGGSGEGRERERATAPRIQAAEDDVRQGTIRENIIL